MSEDPDALLAQAEERDLAISLITDNCRVCLHHLAFYEAGMIASESSAKAILQQICRNDPSESAKLTQQVCTSLFISIRCLIMF